MKPIVCEFEYQDGNGGKDHGKIKVYRHEIKFPEAAPIAFHAVCQWGYEVFHQEKLALKARIEELEAELDNTGMVSWERQVAEAARIRSED